MSKKLSFIGLFREIVELFGFVVFVDFDCYVILYKRFLLIYGCIEGSFFYFFGGNFGFFVYYRGSRRVIREVFFYFWKLRLDRVLWRKDFVDGIKVMDLRIARFFGLCGGLNRII